MSRPISDPGGHGHKLEDEPETWELASALLEVMAHQLSNRLASVDTALRLIAESSGAEVHATDNALVDLALNQVSEALELVSDVGGLTTSEGSIRVSLPTLLLFSRRWVRSQLSAREDAVEIEGKLPRVIVEAAPLHAALAVFLRASLTGGNDSRGTRNDGPLPVSVGFVDSEDPGHGLLSLSLDGLPEEALRELSGRAESQARSMGRDVSVRPSPGNPRRCLIRFSVLPDEPMEESS